jgi:hypothetical protein
MSDKIPYTDQDRMKWFLCLYMYAADVRVLLVIKEKQA